VKERIRKIYSSESQFSLQTVQTPSCHGPDAQVRNSVSYQGLSATTDGGVSSSRSGTGLDDPADTEVSSSRSRTGSDVPVNAEISKSLFAQGPDENAMAANEERVFMHRPDATHKNLFLFRIRFFEAYLKRLCACNFVRFLY